MSDMHRDPLSIALEEQAKKLETIRRQIEGDPMLRSRGILDRLEEVEKTLRELEEAWDDAKSDQRVTSYFRKGVTTGLGLLGIGMTFMSWLMYKILDVLAGGG